MLKYTLQRILLMLMTLLIITCMCFVLVRMLPPVQLPAEDPHTKVILARREAMGYNKPYLVQFGIFLKDIFYQEQICLCLIFHKFHLSKNIHNASKILHSKQMQQ